MPDYSKIGRGFDFLAPIYDRCVKLFFGSRIESLQTAAIKELPHGKNCLIVGGGTGKILNAAIENGLADQFLYAELSTEMIAHTKRRLSQDQLAKVSFTTNFRTKEAKFDSIILPFVLDCYTESQIQLFLEDIKSQLSTEGILLVIDFNEENLNGFSPSQSQKAFVRLLYFVFRLITGIPAKRLPKIIQRLGQNQFHLQHQKVDYNGWLAATFWKLKQH